MNYSWKSLCFLILVHSSSEVSKTPVLGIFLPKHRGRRDDLQFYAGQCSSWQGNLSRASVAEEKSAKQTPDTLAAPLDSHWRRKDDIRSLV